MVKIAWIWEKLPLTGEVAGEDMGVELVSFLACRAWAPLGENIFMVVLALGVSGVVSGVGNPGKTDFFLSLFEISHNFECL